MRRQARPQAPEPQRTVVKEENAPAIAFRAATVADVPGIARARALDRAAGPADPRMARYLEGTHHPGQALPPRVAVLAESDGGVVGYTAGHLTRRFGCQGEVQWLWVAPAFRRRGVARELLRLLAGWFADRRAARVCVDVEPGNVGARHFYRSQGAVELNRHWLVWEDIAALADVGGSGK